MKNGNKNNIEHKYIAAGYLLGNTIHGILNYLTGIRGYVDMLLEQEARGSDKAQLLEAVGKLESKSSDALIRLSDFCRKSSQDIKPFDISQAIEDALKLTWPLGRYSDIIIEKSFEEDLPAIKANKEELIELLAFLIMNSLLDMPEKGALSIKASHKRKEGLVSITLSDTGKTSADKRPLEITPVLDMISRRKWNMKNTKSGASGTTWVIKIPVLP